MQNKKDLAKIAVTALILATTAPIGIQAGSQADGIFLAAGCPAHGCPAQRSNPDGSRQIADNDKSQSQTANSQYSANMTEDQLLKALSPDGRGIYLSLSPEGKALAIHLASQESYRNKNLAVEEARRRSQKPRNQ